MSRIQLLNRKKPILKRVPVIVDYHDDIQRWGYDNLYPQMCEEVAESSYTLKSCLNIISDFISGEGFADPAVAGLKVNENQTMNDLLMDVAKYMASYRSFVLWVGYSLNFRINELIVVPIEYVRYGIADKEGCYNHFKYTTNWEQDYAKTVFTRQVDTYNVFDPYEVANQVAAVEGLSNYNGQLFFYTPRYGSYPKSTFDAVIERAQAQSELGVFKISSIDNAFTNTTAVVYPSSFADEAERADFIKYLEKKIGPEAAGGVIGIEDKSGQRKASDMFFSLTPTNIDRLYEYTEKSIADAIAENYGMPKELLGMRPESGMFNKDNMVDAYTYANSITRKSRQIISSQFKKILQFWETSIISDCKILTLKYGVEDSTGSQPGESATTANETLLNLTGRQMQNLLRIQSKFAKGKLTYEQAKNLIVTAFGMTPEQADQYLITTEEEDEQVTNPS